MGLTLLRHTKVKNADGICYGRTDLALADDFLDAADAVLTKLPRPKQIYSSPLLRCHQLAAHIGAHFDLPITVDQALIEIDFGLWEGIAWDDIDPAVLDEWAADLLHFNGFRGETASQLLARVDARLARAHEGELWVTHAGVIRAALFVRSGEMADWHRPLAWGEQVEIAL